MQVGGGVGLGNSWKGNQSTSYSGGEPSKTVGRSRCEPRSTWRPQPKRKQEMSLGRRTMQAVHSRMRLKGVE